MIEKRNPDHIATEIRMGRTQFKGVYCIVEGSTDVKFLRKYVEQNARMVVAGHKAGVVGAIDILNADGVRNVVAITDADFARVGGLVGGRRANHHEYDGHDMEVMLIESPALLCVLREFASDEKLQRFEERHGPCRDRLFEVASVIGAMRLASIQNGWNLKFDERKYDSFLPHDTPVVDKSALAKAILDHSQQHALRVDEVVCGSDSILASVAGHDEMNELCCGHDMTAILRVWFRRLLGTKKLSEVSIEDLEMALRTGFEWAHWRRTKMFAAMVAWESANGVQFLSQE